MRFEKIIEMTRLSYQHRAFYCYVILSIWIFLLLAGMYKYIGMDENSSIKSKTINNELSIKDYPRNFKSDVKSKKIYRFCNSPIEIIEDTEGNLDGNLTLTGVLVLIRHGDRGPLSHVRNISNVNCLGDMEVYPELETVYNNYQNYIQNVSNYYRTGWTQFLGPFHGFPMFPSNPRDCRLGQLTSLGIVQLIKTGALLKNAYYKKLNLNNVEYNKDIIIYSTRYRRTVQSAVALIYGLFDNEDFQQNFNKIILQESQSYAFCDNDCACPAAEKLLKLHSKEISNHLKSHPAVFDLIRQASNVVFEIPDQAQINDANALKDALLTYLCHGATLPCADFSNQRICLKSEHVTGLFTYLEWEAKQLVKSNNRKKHGLLKSYGLLRNIVNHMLRMLSETKPKIVLYSGHDKTLQYLATSLGIITDKTTMPHYASRLIIEVYKIHSKSDNHAARDFYFRVIVNGKDLTYKIPFCRRSNYYTVNYFQRNEDNERIMKESQLCPIEAIIRHLHDDYFLPFNATNYKDACNVSRG